MLIKLSILRLSFLETFVSLFPAMIINLRRLGRLKLKSLVSLFEHVKSYTSTSSNCLDVLSFIISLVLFECNQKSTIGIFYPNYPVISDMDEWKTEIRTNGGAVQDYTISYQNLDPLTTYYFRVIAYNEFGISEPCTTDETVR